MGWATAALYLGFRFLLVNSVGFALSGPDDAEAIVVGQMRILLSSLVWQSHCYTGAIVITKQQNR
jgi:hypothetical protein